MGKFSNKELIFFFLFYSRTHGLTLQENCLLRKYTKKNKKKQTFQNMPAENFTHHAKPFV